MLTVSVGVTIGTHKPSCALKKKLFYNNNFCALISKLCFNFKPKNSPTLYSSYNLYSRHLINISHLVSTPAIYIALTFYEAFHVSYVHIHNEWCDIFTAEAHITFFKGEIMGYSAKPCHIVSGV